MASLPPGFQARGIEVAPGVYRAPPPLGGFGGMNHGQPVNGEPSDADVFAYMNRYGVNSPYGTRLNQPPTPATPAYALTDVSKYNVQNPTPMAYPSNYYAPARPPGLSLGALLGHPDVQSALAAMGQPGRIGSSNPAFSSGLASVMSSFAPGGGANGVG